MADTQIFSPGLKLESQRLAATKGLNEGDSSYELARSILTVTITRRPGVDGHDHDSDQRHDRLAVIYWIGKQFVKQ